MIYYNANAFGNDVEDCAIRSISVAEGISWDEAYRKLSDYARERGLMISSVESVEQYLDEHYNRMCIEDMTVLAQLISLVNKYNAKPCSRLEITSSNLSTSSNSTTGSNGLNNS